MDRPYSQSFAKSRRSHYIALAKMLSRGTLWGMGLDDSVRRRLVMLLEEKDMSVNALADRADMREGTIRALVDGTTQSTRLSTIEKLAKGLGVTPGYLLGVENAPISRDLFCELLKRLLRPLFPQEAFVEKIAQSILQAYEAGIDTGVDPSDARDLDILTSLEADRLRSEARSLKVVK